jgi:hypothetical protein
VLLGHGDGTFATANVYLLNEPSPGPVGLGDVNGDGKLDLVTNSSPSVSVLLGDGDGTLQPPTSAGSGQPLGSVVMGDLNGDGNLDLVIRTSDNNGVRILKGNGDGTFQPGQDVVIGSYVSSVAVGDINADGKLDLVANWSIFTPTDCGYYGCYAGYSTAYANVLLGYGDGSFAPPSTTTLGDAFPDQTALADLNGDGLPDLAVTNDGVWVALNAGDWVLPPPTLSIGDVTVTEGNGGAVNATFTVSLSAAHSQTVTVQFSTADGSATAGSDYVATSGALTFAPGETSQAITVAVLGDRLPEPNETFFVNLSSPTNAGLGDDRGVGTILDDEPRLSINDVTKREGRSGTTLFVFTVSLSVAYDQPVTVNFATANGTATAGSDYQAGNGTLTFQPGQTTATITIVVYGDKKKEADEYFSLNLFGASNNALIVDDAGVGWILNDDNR